MSSESLEWGGLGGQTTRRSLPCWMGSEGGTGLQLQARGLMLAGTKLKTAHVSYLLHQEN